MKASNNGLTLNYHALAPLKYKRSVVRSFVHRIYNSCSNWSSFHCSMDKMKTILENNQYPADFYEPIIHNTLEKIFVNKKQEKTKRSILNVQGKKMFFIQYRGVETMNYVKRLIDYNAPIMPIFTTRKLKTALPSLKEPIPKDLTSNVIYKLCCTGCDACYVGMTTRHLITRIKEHLTGNSNFKIHKAICDGQGEIGHSYEILDKTNRGWVVLQVLEALHQRDIRPELNTKDEYRGRTLRIRL